MSVFSWLGKAIGLQNHKFFVDYYGALNNTGQTVTTNSALSVAAAWACIRLLSESVGIMPLGVYRKNANGGRDSLPEHPAYRLIHNKPNDSMTADEIWQAVAGSLATEGNALLFPLKYRGDVTALEFIPWRDVNVIEEPKTWALKYQFQWHGVRKELGGDDVIAFRGFGNGGKEGLSAIRYGAQTLGIAMAADRSAGRAFRSGKNPAGFISTEKNLDKQQRADLKDSLAERATHDADDGIMLLPGGLKWERTGITASDLQLLEARGFSVEQTCSLFRVPPFMIGHTEKNTSWGAGLEQQTLAFLTFALSPYLKRIEERLKLQLLSEDDRNSGVYIEFNREALLQADSAGRAALYSVFANNGIFTRNEIRALENRSSKPGGDDLTVQSALIRLQDLSKMVDQPGAAGGGADAQKARQALRAWLDVQDQKLLPAPDPARQD